ncbi:hypothetical protein [Pseudomonas amygdali]|uniref:hypothetical protein n=1 Tax=Pseudomonas amygdali TaxID=47877 RepID=UPI000ADEE094|nr:hypothetical protein [Pseudomonas amygdali]
MSNGLIDLEDEMYRLYLTFFPKSALVQVQHKPSHPFHRSGKPADLRQRLILSVVCFHPLPHSRWCSKHRIVLELRQQLRGLKRKKGLLL